MKGTVKFFNDMKRFGFIAGEDDKEYFVHKSGLKEGVSIAEGDSVEFDGEEGDRGLKAVNVSKAESNEEDSGESSEESEESNDESEEDSGEESEESNDESEEDSGEESEESQEDKE